MSSYHAPLLATLDGVSDREGGDRTSVLLLPPTLFALYLLSLVGRGSWRLVFIWVSIMVSLAVISALFIIRSQEFVSYTPLEEGESYAWSGWYWILLIGLYQSGFVLLVFHVGKWIWGMVNWRWRGSSNLPPVVTS